MCVPTSPSDLSRRVQAVLTQNAALVDEQKMLTQYVKNLSAKAATGRR